MLEPIVVVVRNVIFGGILFWWNGCQILVVLISLEQLLALVPVPA